MCLTPTANRGCARGQSVDDRAPLQRVVGLTRKRDLKKSSVNRGDGNRELKATASPRGGVRSKPEASGQRTLVARCVTNSAETEPRRCRAGESQTAGRKRFATAGGAKRRARLDAAVRRFEIVFPVRSEPRASRGGPVSCSAQQQKKLPFCFFSGTL